MKRIIGMLLVCLLLLTGCLRQAQEAPETVPPVQPEQTAQQVPVTRNVLTVQRGLPLSAEGQEHLNAVSSWLDITTEVFQVDDIPAVITYRNDGGTDKPVYIVPHPTWTAKEGMLEFMPTGVGDVNALFLSFDMTGFGDSPRAEVSREQAVQDAVADLDKLLNYLAAQGMVNLDRIIIEGMEMGADVAIAYTENGRYTPAIITIKDQQRAVGTYAGTQVLDNVDFDVRGDAYQKFLLHRTALNNPEPEAVTVQEGSYTAPAATVPAPTAPVSTTPPAPETTAPTAPAPTAPPVPAADQGTITLNLTVERNRPFDRSTAGGLISGAVMESIRVNDLAAMVAYREDGQKKPVYVYLHGSGGGKEDGYRFLEYIVNDVNGIFVSFDMPYGGESTHTMRTLTGAEVICGVVPDIDNLLAYVSTLPGADMNNIYMEGMSGGAASALAYMTRGIYTPSLLMVTVPCFDFRTYGENGPPYNIITVEGDPTPPLSTGEIDAILDEHNAYLHPERLMDTYVLAGIGLSGPPNAEADGQQMEALLRQMGKTDMEFNFYPGVDHNIPESFYDTASSLMMAMRGGSDIVNPTVRVNITQR